MATCVSAVGVAALMLVRVPLVILLAFVQGVVASSNFAVRKLSTSVWVKSSAAMAEV